MVVKYSLNQKEDSMEKRKGCRRCSLYSASLGRCKAGKINPTTLKGAKSAAMVMGVSYICNINGMQEKIK
jgi:hypothetical protein